MAESSNAANKQQKRKLSDTYSEDDEKITLDLLSNLEGTESADKNKAPKLDSGALRIQDSPVFPINLRGMIRQWCQPFEKELTKSDLGEAWGLELSSKKMSDCMNALLTDKERETIESSPSGIPVTVYDADCNAYSMELKAWMTDVGVTYVLAGGQWKYFRETRLEWLNPNGDDSVAIVIKVWMFRHVRLDHNLCFVISARTEKRD